MLQGAEVYCRDREHKTSLPIGWDASLGCWCVHDATSVAAIMKSRDFHVVDYADVYRLIQQRVGVNCPTLLRALSHIPLANEGKAHADLRENWARLIVAQTNDAKRHLAPLISETVKNSCKNNSRVDLVKSIAGPISDSFFALLLGTDLPANVGEDASVSQIFDRFLSLNRRKTIDAKANCILQHFSAATDALKTTPDYALGLTIVGHDSLVASLAGSLLAVLEKGTGKPLCELAWPQSLPSTGVPYVERIAMRDSQIGSIKVRAGERVRLYIDERRQFFGKGRHSCLGEDIATWIWRRLTAELSRLPYRFSIEDVRRRERDYVFAYYSSVVVQFHD